MPRRRPGLEGSAARFLVVQSTYILFFTMPGLRTGGHITLGAGGRPKPLQNNSRFSV